MWFRGVVVITSASHAEGREFETRLNLVLLVFAKNAVCVKMFILHKLLHISGSFIDGRAKCTNVWFRGVVVITSASHAEGREFETRRNLASQIFLVDLNILKRLCYRQMLLLCTIWQKCLLFSIK